MALAFPSSPTNGQIYNQYVYSTAIGAWQNQNDPTNVANLITGKANLAGNNTFTGLPINPNMPAFHAYGNQTGTTTYSANNTIGFENARYNIGSNYNTTTSRFTAPVSGIYVFWFEAFNQSGAEQRVAFKINGDTSQQQFGQGQTSGSTAYRQTVTAKLAANDYISVIVAYNSTSIYKWPYHNEWGGCLLFGV